MCGPYGCTARTALNYRPFAVTDDGSCVQGGCMDSRFDAFEPGATFDDGSCPPVLPGCMQHDASNYRALATVEHESSSCLYQGPGRGLGLGLEGWGLSVAYGERSRALARTL